MCLARPVMFVVFYKRVNSRTMLIIIKRQLLVTVWCTVFTKLYSFVDKCVVRIIIVCFGRI